MYIFSSLLNTEMANYHGGFSIPNIYLRERWCHEFEGLSGRINLRCGKIIQNRAPEQVFTECDRVMPYGAKEFG